MIIKDYKSARHLSSRLEIGVDDEQSKARVGQHVADVLDAMIPVTNVEPAAPALTAWETNSKFYGASIESQRELVMQAQVEGRVLTAWWLEQIHKTQFPLLERMTLFWHNHFTSDIDKVTWPQFMYWQNKLLRKHALGNFSDLLHEILRDPAMLMFLDGAQNVVGNPNENLAREFLELFTLGEGNYSEADIVDVARALTGWKVDLQAGSFKFESEHHDFGEKKFLNRQGDLNGDDIVTILLRVPRMAEYIAEKFWREFINHDVSDPVIIRSWAKIFRNSGYEIKVLLHSVIHSQVFWDEANTGRLIKSPVEFSVGLLRELGLELNDYEVLRKANQQLGQDLFRPPDVKGWRGGTEWITNTRLVRRYDLIPKLMSEHNGDAKNMLEESVIRPRINQSENISQFKGIFRKMVGALSCSANSSSLTDWLLAEEPILPPDCDLELVNMLYTLLRDPTYQLR